MSENRISSQISVELSGVALGRKVAQAATAEMRGIWHEALEAVQGDALAGAFAAQEVLRLMVGDPSDANAAPDEVLAHQVRQARRGWLLRLVAPDDVRKTDVAEMLGLTKQRLNVLTRPYGSTAAAADPTAVRVRRGGSYFDAFREPSQREEAAVARPVSAPAVVEPEAAVHVQVSLVRSIA